jgi:hypothetical protein
MEIDPPAWRLNKACPCCDQFGLTFSTCPTCGLVVLVCAEVNTVFGISGKQCGPAIGWFGSDETCAKCGASEYSALRNSTSEEVRALGFQPGDYY